jgi:short-subunit dehydrogenase
MRICGTRVLITGASRGIGRELARGFAAAGADVALVARSAAGLEELAQELGGRAYAVDLTDRDELRGLIARIEADGPVDILVNNAGDESVGSFTAMDADTLEFVIHLNVLAAAELTRQAVPGMLARKRGHIVNISSYAGVVIPPNLVTYSATKAFLTHHSVNLRFELKDTPIGVTKVELGEVAETGMLEKGRTNREFTALMERMYRLRLSRLLRPAEITPAVLRAVEENKASVRLPRRMALSSLLVDAPRRLTWGVAHGLTTPPVAAAGNRSSQPSRGMPDTRSSRVATSGRRWPPPRRDSGSPGRSERWEAR